MSIEKNNIKRKKRRALKVRNQLRRVSDLPRLSVFRSLDHIYAQIIDDTKGATVVSASSLKLSQTNKENKSEVARTVGKMIAELALEKGLKKVAFDRGSYLYHGRVKALAEGARTGGLEL